MRLDHFLARQFPQVSRVVLRRATADVHIVVNGRKSRSSHQLRVGDIVQTDFDPSPHPALLPEPIPLRIASEDEHILVVDKPAGLLVYPNKTVRSGTLMNALCHYLRQQEPDSRPGMVHRLDKNTSGLMVIAKHEQAHRVLARHFRKRLVKKKYLALVHGVVVEDSFEISLPIGWIDDGYPHRQPTANGQEALTVGQVLDRFSGFTLLEIEPKTGRTHQIRIHLASIGHSIMGDDLYGGRQHQLFQQEAIKGGMTINRHFLHASFLQFNHPRTGESLSFRSSLPEELSGLFDRMRQQKTTDGG